MLGTPYERFISKTDNYTIEVEDDVIKFVIASGKTGTLPKAQLCKNDQQVKYVVNDISSVGNLLMAVASGDASVGNLTLLPGRGAFLISDANGTWYLVGPSGAGSGTISETDLSFSDITTADATSSKHGLMPKLTPGIATASAPVTLGSTKNLDTLALDALTGNDSSLGVTGKADTQGGAIVVTGGTSSTAGNAGGAVNLVGGTPGVTGAGGAVGIAGAVGGATSGLGGAAAVVGGAGTAGNSAGGVGSVTGGAGQGSAAGGIGKAVGGLGGATGAGGAAQVTGGAGGATSGSGGAATITGGAGTAGNATGGIASVVGGAGQGTGAGAAAQVTGGASGGGATGNGGAVTVTGGAAGSTDGNGGHVNLVGGAKAGTGTAGEVQINGNAGLIPIELNYTASLVTQAFYVASRAVRVKAIIGRVRVQGSGGACTVSFYKAPSGTAVGSGTLLHTGSYNLVGTVDTNQSLSLSSTVSEIELAAGDSIGYVLTGTPTSAVGNVTVTVVPI